jgi:hypothetical protein
MGKPPFKASEGGCFENLRVSEDITPSEFQQGKGTRMPIRPKVRLEASPNGLPMSVSSKVYATLRITQKAKRLAHGVKKMCKTICSMFHVLCSYILHSAIRNQKS